MLTDGINNYRDELVEKIGSLSLEEWKLQPDLAIGRAMKEIKTWEESLALELWLGTSPESRAQRIQDKS